MLTTDNIIICNNQPTIYNSRALKGLEKPMPEKLLAGKQMQAEHLTKTDLFPTPCLVGIHKVLLTSDDLSLMVRHIKCDVAHTLFFERSFCL